MYVCLCHGVTDRQIQDEVAQGASNLREISQRLGVATQCGKCGKCARGVIRDSLEARCSEPEDALGTVLAMGAVAPAV